MLGIVIDGKSQIVPGVYSTLAIENSLTNPLPGPRNVLIIGEADSGVPGAQLDLRGVYFSNANDVKAYFKSGPLVDAATMLFTAQPSPVFSSSVSRVYCYKTNQSTQATRAIKQGVSVYGAINAMAHGTDGNLISSKIVSGNPYAYPSASLNWLMTPTSPVFNISINGQKFSISGVGSETRPEVVANTIRNAVGGAGGFTISNGRYYQIIGASQLLSSGAGAGSTMPSISGTPAAPGTGLYSDRLGLAVDSVNKSKITISVTHSIDGTTYTAGVFTGLDLNAVVPGTLMYINKDSVIAGAGLANVGCYYISQVTQNAIVAYKITSCSATTDLAIQKDCVPVAASSSTALVGDMSNFGPNIGAGFVAYEPIYFQATGIPTTGSGASIELFNAGGDLFLAQRVQNFSAMSQPITSAVAIGGAVSLTVGSSGLGTFAISNGSFSSIPKPGSVLWVGLGDSLLAGATRANTGAWVVVSAGTSNIVAQKVLGVGESVASVMLNGSVAPFMIAAPLASTSLASNLIVASVEPTVYVVASRQSDGKTFPQTAVGGRIVLEVGYAGDTATLSIDQNGYLSTLVTGGVGSAISGLNLAAYRTIADLIKYINTLPGYSAKVSNPQYNTLKPYDVLDRVTSINICSGFAATTSSCPGRLKADYYDFKNLFALNPGFISFGESDTFVKKAGLPSVESVAVFLSGGIKGATSNMNIMDSFTKALKVDVTQVVPLFSRDSSADIVDQLTDPLSSYNILSVMSGLLSHVNTASNTDYRKERIGVGSYHASFADTVHDIQSISSQGSARLAMFFQMVNAVGADGNLKWWLPWMGACMIAAGRAQSRPGTSMLRKTFACTGVKHPGAVSVYDQSLLNDFDPDDKADQESAISAGLLFLRSVSGSGQRMESPDASTYASASTDPKEWYYSRTNVIYVLDDVIKTTRSIIESFIGNSTIDVSPAVLRKSLSDVLTGFINAKELKGFEIQGVVSLGNGYKVTIRVLPPEAVEYIELNFVCGRDVTQS